MKAVSLTLLSIAVAASSLIREKRLVDKTACQQADLVFVLDVSNSIGDVDFEKGLQFVNKIVDLYEIGTDYTRVGVVTFGEEADVQFKLNEYQTKNDIMGALYAIPYGVKGLATLTYAGLNKARKELLHTKNGARDEVPDIVVVITDGKTNPGGAERIPQAMGKAKTQKEASQLRKMGATVFAIGVGGHVDQQELRGMVGGKGERYLQAESYDELNTEVFFKDVEYKLCKDPNKQCVGKKMDIAFVLDGSSSLREEKNFKKELSFVTGVVERIRMSNNETQVSIVKFSDDATLEVPFNMYSDVQALKRKVQTIRWEGGDTYMNEAFDMLVDTVFTSRNGARPGVEKLVVVITDGGSTNREMTKAATKRVHGMGANVFAIGVGPHVNTTELKKISSNSQYYMVDNIDALSSVQSILNDQICPNNTERCYQQPLEISFLLDSSTSLNSTEMFYKELGFVAGLSERFDIGQQNTRFSVISFSNDAVLNVKLTDSVSKKALQDRIVKIKYMRGDTYTNKAVDLMMNKGFENARRGVLKIGVVITDGSSTDPYTLKDVIQEVKKTDIQMVAIGVGDAVNMEELENIASDKKNVFPVVGVEALKFIEDMLIKVVCTAAVEFSNVRRFPA